MTESTNTEQRQWNFPAQITEVDRVCEELSAWLMKTNLGKHVFAIQMLAREGLNNAVLHGSEHNIELNVHFHVQVRLDAVVLEISDEGKGFDWQNQMNQDEVPIDRTSGRGLWIYRLFADSIEFNQSGNNVRLTRTVR